MRNLIVTGGCGFIGSNFIRFLLTETDFDGRVVNVDKLTYAGNPENTSDIDGSFADRYVLEQADIREARAVSRIFGDYDIDTVVHFAAETHVDRSIAGPGDFLQTNVIGTYNLLEAARERKNFQLFHHVSTDEVFGSLGPEGYFNEKTAYQPNSPYAASKASSDHFVRAYHRTYGLPTVISNCSNNYGPFQFPEKLIPLIILNALECKPLPVYGDGLNVRDWLYVRDHCTALHAVMQHGRRGETYNIGGRCEKTNLEVVETICGIVDELRPEMPPGMRSRRELIRFVADRPGHDQRYSIDCSKIQAELGWCPEESFQTGLRKTVQWYLDHSEWVERVRSGEYREWIAQNYDRRAFPCG